MPMATFAGRLVDAAAGAVTGAPSQLNIYACGTGWTRPALWMSLAAIGGGLMMLGALRRLRALWDSAPAPRPSAIFDAAMAA
jgi:multicomponent K+:H+ antiporter subunit A